MSEIKNKPPDLLFVFLRHGQSTGNAEKRHQGQADFPLTDTGILQAEQLLKPGPNKQQRSSLMSLIRI